jgi:hypothetical protein
MKKHLDIGQPLKAFDGEPIKGQGGKDFTLKDVLLGYLGSAHLMGLTPMEEGYAYELGVLVGTAAGEVALEPHQYDLLKKLVDSGKVKNGSEMQPLFSIVVAQQAKRMVDAAGVKKE